LVGVTAAPHDRHRALTTTFNFRDVGGYAGLDGRTVRWRRLFRSDSLHRLSAADLAVLAELGVRTVIDLRRPLEVRRHGRVPHFDGLDYRHFPVEHLDWDEVEFPAGVGRERWLADRYLNFTADGHVALAATLSALADADRAPVVVHCMAGKDRTGVACALALSLLGVADRDVAADYALTTAAMAPLTAYLQGQDPNVVVDGKDHMFDSPAEAMALFLADLRAEHGSAEGYARAIGVTDAQIAALRAHLLS
jgi:protein tyrosine/serine phosphatase